MISDDNSMADDFSKKILFGVLCMQLSFEKLYNYIVIHRRMINNDFMIQLAKLDDSTSDKSEIKEALPPLSDQEAKRIAGFIRSLNSILDVDHDEELSDEEILQLINVLGFSAITSTTDATDNNEEEEKWAYRRLNRRIIKTVNDMLKKKYKKEFAVYQSNSDRGDWKFHNALGHKEFHIKSGAIAKMQYKIITDLPNKNSCLTIEFERYRDLSKELFLEALEPLMNTQEYVKKLDENGDCWSISVDYPENYFGKEDSFQKFIYEKVIASLNLILNQDEYKWFLS